MAKVILIRPRSFRSIAMMPRLPLALLYIGRVLKHNGHDVKLIDTNTESNYYEQIINECVDASLVGVSALTSEVRHGLEITRLIKGSVDDVPIVWGGIHPSLFSEMTCEEESIDYVVAGEGELSTLELMEAIAGNRAITSVDGLFYKTGVVVKGNKQRTYLDLNSMPMVDYSLIDMEKYFEGGTWRRAVDVQSSRGCPYKCRYCINHALGTHKMRFMSSERVIDECERLVVNYGANYITFIDDNFFINKKRAVEICEGIISRGLKFEWFAEVRADFFRDGFIDREFLELAERSGLRNLTIGAESGVPRLLELMNKRITTDDIITSAEMLSKTKISTAYSFIIGLPDESVSEINQTLEFVEKLRATYPHAVFNVGVLRAYPKTEFTDCLVNEGWINPPRTLEGFSENSEVYTSNLLKPVWHVNPNYAFAVTQYAHVAYGSFNRQSVRSHLKFASLLLLPEVILQKVALWRLKHHFFRFKLDVCISNILRHVYYQKWVRGVIHWKK